MTPPKTPMVEKKKEGRKIFVMAELNHHCNLCNEPVFLYQGISSLDYYRNVYVHTNCLLEKTKKEAEEKKKEFIESFIFKAVRINPMVIVDNYFRELREGKRKEWTYSDLVMFSRDVYFEELKSKLSKEVFGGKELTRLDKARPEKEGKYLVCEPYSKEMNFIISYFRNGRSNDEICGFNDEICGANEVLFWKDLPKLPKASRELRTRRCIKNNIGGKK